MGAGIGIQPLGISVEHCPEGGREGTVPLRLYRPAGIDDKGQHIQDGAIFTLHRGQLAINGQQRDLDAGKIVFRMGPGQSISRLGVGLGVNVRHAPGVAYNGNCCWINPGEIRCRLCRQPERKQQKYDP